MSSVLEKSPVLETSDVLEKGPVLEKSPVLETRALSKRFGALEVAKSIDFRLAEGARHALIGPNGAGKTTFINLLTGVLPPSGGRVLLRGEDVTGLRADRRVKRGLARTFQVTTLFADLTPLEAVTLAICEREGLTARWTRAIAAHPTIVDEAATLLTSLRLGAVPRRRTRDLAYGQQRILEVALALACRPKVLLLDEPAAGIPARESAALFDVIAGLPGDVALLFIEHDMHLVFRFATRITVLAAGAILMEGSPAEVAADERVRAVYLGKTARTR
jgi:branched-chain amino acid transport system ATP-binding protein